MMNKDYYGYLPAIQDSGSSAKTSTATLDCINDFAVTDEQHFVTAIKDLSAGVNVTCPAGQLLAADGVAYEKASSYFVLGHAISVL